MKTKILLFCIVLGMLFAFAAHSLTTYNEIGNHPREIPLQGDFQNPGRPRADVILVVAEQQGNIIFAHFQETIGVVQITITNKWGENVFTEMVNAAVQPTFTILLTELPAGSYVITFSNENGELSGRFEL